VIFITENDAMGMGFEKIKLNFEKRINGEGCKAIALNLKTFKVTGIFNEGRV
jgi:hypothetical protein